MAPGNTERHTPQQHPPSDPPNYETLSSLPNGHTPGPTTHDTDEYIQTLPRIHHAPHSSRTPRRNNRRGTTRHTPPSRLGVIDEQSNTIAPDVPNRNPKRRLPGYNNKHKFFTFAFYLEKENVPPVDAYDRVVGPHGEKFGDLRSNKLVSPRGRGGSRKLICLGLVIAAVVAVALGVGLGVGLTRRKGTSHNTTSLTSNNSSLPFPIGTFTIPAYLAATNTSCTANAATWRCYPYTTYSSSSTSPQSQSQSYSPLVWRITSPSASTTLNLSISATQPTFSYPFANIPLTLASGNDNSHAVFTFNYTFRKMVIPSADITAAQTGAATRCYYNNTLLAVWLYATAEGAGGKVTGPPNNTLAQNQNQTASAAGMGVADWPYAVQYEETISEAPECYTFVNGEDGDAVDVMAGNGECGCGYRNFDLG